MKRVLVVDNHAPVLRMLRLGIEEAGFEVDTAVSGPECLVKLFGAAPDFLVADIDLPHLSGKQLCLAIEARFPKRVFPIVVMTSRTNHEYLDWPSEVSNLEFMAKPVSLRRLITTIRRHLNGQD